MRKSIRTVFCLVAASLVAACSKPVTTNYSGPVAEWPNFGGSAGGGRYSNATQINPDNVHALEKVWEYRTGHFRRYGEVTATYPNGYTFEAMGSAWQLTPLMVDGVLYGCSAFNKMFALDPATGEELWSLDPGVDVEKELMVNCRGVSSWKSTSETGHCSHRIFLGTMDARLLARDAKTGKACEDFGNKGSVDMTVGIGEHKARDYGSMSPPAIIGDKLITGSAVLDRIHDNMPSGVVRAYDVHSGEMLWYWDPIAPGQESQYNERGEPQYKRGTTNVWSIISVDEERDLIFLPTGNTSTDFYGGQRDSLDYWSSSVVALRGSTGEVVWRFQMVHHDIWDYDTPSQPTLFDFEQDGKVIPALAQPTKMGLLFLLNRETGEPIFPVEERPVPQDGAVAGEYLSPTQPFPTKPEPLHPLSLPPEDAWGITPWDRNDCKAQLSELRNEGIYTPPSTTGTVFYPSDFGGNNWDSPAIDQARNIAVLNTRKVPMNLKLLPREECKGPMGGLGPQMGTPYCMHYEPIVSPLGVPCNEPPWGTLIAVDLNAGEKLWEVPLGNLEHMAPWPVSKLIEGPPNIGGPAITASGLIFIAGTPDQYIRAFSIEDGKELWRAPLPTGGHATPMTYRAGPDQKQYLVIAAGGHFGMGQFGQEPSDHLIAFALPD